MKQRFKYILAALAFGGVLLAVPLVQAENSPNYTNTSTSGSSASQTELEAIKHRIEMQKTDLKIKLTALQETRIKLRCQASQTVVTKLYNQVNTRGAIRTQVYQNIFDRLNNLVTKLKAKNVDTGTLQQEITTLTAKIATYKTDLTNYTQALNDLKTFDCKTDPTGFKAALETARNDRTALSAAVLDIRHYLTTTIKQTLIDIRTQLGKTESTTTNSSGGGSQ